ncbi:hypothetical protein AB0I49_16185 [Streptomyces sp. NPDC050617]|uniref:hypothetical protein n=1 Tax=Streptomyces sp. NPDC050617 TaxID=3154628 RepID=UPI0034296FD8
MKAFPIRSDEQTSAAHAYEPLAGQRPNDVAIHCQAVNFANQVRHPGPPSRSAVQVRRPAKGAVGERRGDQTPFGAADHLALPPFSGMPEQMIATGQPNNLLITHRGGLLFDAEP